MKKSKAETAETRKRIIEVAALTFKNKGIHATGVAEIMSSAGLTHGGFYRHFGSKEQLIAEATATSMELRVQAAETAAEGGRASFLAHLEGFLSAESPGDHLGGCPLVAMGSELVRCDAKARRAVSQGFQELVDVIAKWDPLDDGPSARAEALFTLSSLIGAVTVSRIVDDPKLSRQILDAAKKRLVSRPVKALRKPPRRTAK